VALISFSPLVVQLFVKPFLTTADAFQETSPVSPLLCRQAECHHHLATALSLICLVVCTSEQQLVCKGRRISLFSAELMERSSKMLHLIHRLINRPAICPCQAFCPSKQELIR
jgi:hypothetical protein